MSNEPFLFREVFNKQMVENLAQSIKLNYPKFSQIKFTEEIIKELPNLSYGDRSKLITEKLHRYLPKEYKVAVEIMIDYKIFFLKANGKKSPKVFKLTQKTIKSGENLKIKGKHKFGFYKNVSYYPGKHQLSLQINGQDSDVLNFDLSLKTE
jgi:hypothetical protein